MDFIAIDFETANQRRDSACQLAAVVVRQGKIVEKRQWLIKPRPFFFSPWNIEIHGIRPENVADEPEFGEVWPTMAPYLQTDCLVAHNAPFDISVLLECLRTHGHRVPDLAFTCTRLIARAAWPGRQGYGLKPIANWLGVDFRHHDALEDSIACAKILLAAAVTAQAASLEELESKLKLSRGFANASEYQGACKAKRTRRATPASTKKPSQWPRPLPTPEELETVEPEIDLQRLMIRAEFIRPLCGKQVLICGDLKRLSLEHAELLATKLGASVAKQASQPDDAVQLLTEYDLINLVQHRVPAVT
jgi:DNA polymerase-3 subunit epsilon